MKRVTLFLLITIVLFSVACKKDDNKAQNEVYKYDIKSPSEWHLSSVPDRFPESKLTNTTANGFNRAMLAWYCIDPSFLRKSSYRPSYITNDDVSNHLVREIKASEIYEETDSSNVLTILNLNFYPSERGPYNFDTNSSTYSKGIDYNGNLNNPETRWAGISKYLTQVDSKISFIELWLMDPFIYDNTIQGDIYIDLGDISEDIIKDGRISYEGGLSLSENDTSCWGFVPKKIDYLSSLSNYQDVGYDGLNDVNEITFFSTYQNNLKYILKPDVYSKIAHDLSCDNFLCPFDNNYDVMQASIIERYKYWNGSDGNSTQSNNQNGTCMSSSISNNEDLDHNKTLDTANNYFEYKISLRKQDFVVGSNFINGIKEPLVKLPNGKQENVKWYNFKIPVESFDNMVGNYNAASVPKYIRIYLTGFNKQVVLRFAEIKLGK